MKKIKTKPRRTTEAVAIADILPANGNGKKTQKNSTRRLQKKSADVTSEESFNSRELLRVLTEVKNGNFRVRMPLDEVGVTGKIFDTLNEIIALNEEMTFEFMRAGNSIGKRGQLTQRISLPSANGSWREGVNSLNVLISDLVHPTIQIAHVISSVAKGDLSQEMPEEIEN